jgi:hypothetical protein
MADQENWWESSPVVAKPNQVQQVEGGVYVPPAPEKPEKPTETFRFATGAEKKAAELDPARAYQVNKITGEFKDVGGQPTAKLAAEDPNRAFKINSALDALKNIRKLAEQSLSVGETAGRVRETPVIGAVLGQNRADLEGALSLVNSNLIQDQLAYLAKLNPQGMATLANTENEAARLAASIANLDPNQSLDQFLTGVQRAEDYYKRQLSELGSAPVGASRAPVAGLTEALPGDRVVAEIDLKNARDLQAKWQGSPNLSTEELIKELNAISVANVGSPLTPESIAALTLDTDRTTQFQPYLAPMEDVTEGMGIVEGAIETVTGSERSTPEIEATADWTTMPELNELSIAGARTGIGTMFTSPEESVKIIQANYPNVEVRQDEKGNYILRSQDGKDYGIKPGFRFSDVPRAVGGILAFTPAGRAATFTGAALKSGATQAAIEGTEFAAGGEFNAAPIALATAAGPAEKIIGDVVSAALPQVTSRVRQLTGRPEVPLSAAPAPPPTVAPIQPSSMATARAPEQAIDILSLPDDELVTLYHGTTKEAAEKIKQTGTLKSAGEPSVYLTTDRTGGGYGDGTVVPVRVRRGLLEIDDEFPDGRMDFRIDLDRPGGSVPVQVAAEVSAPTVTAPASRPAGGAMSTSEETIRVQRAAELPVPIELARFQRTRDFAEQQRARELAKNNEVGGPIRDRMAQQQDELRQNFEQFIDGTGSEVWNNPYEQGGVIADALGTLAKRERTRTNALYKRAEKAGEMREPIDYTALSDFIAQQTPTTREQLAPVLKTVEEQLLANDPNKTGMISLNLMEDIRKLINKVASPGTPNASFGRDMRGIIDNATKDAGGDVYKQARASRAKYARDFEDIDLVQKVFDTKPGSTERYVGLEKITDKIIGEGTPLDSVKHLLGLLEKAGPRGTRAMRELQGSVMEKIRDQAYRGITTDESGQTLIQPAALNKIITSLNKNGKLDVIFDKKTAELLNTINEVTKDIITSPPGSVNASGTSSAIMNAVDTLGTFGITGLPVPAAKIFNDFRKAMAARGMRKEVKRLLD